MHVAMATDAHNRHSQMIGIDERSMQFDRAGNLLAFGVWVGNNARGEALFAPYVISHDSRNPLTQAWRAVRDALTGSAVLFDEVTHAAHAPGALSSGPNAMRAAAVRGVSTGILKAGIAIACSEAVVWALTHAGRPHYFVPVSGHGQVFLAPLDA